MQGLSQRVVVGVVLATAAAACGVWLGVQIGRTTVASLREQIAMLHAAAATGALSAEREALRIKQESEHELTRLAVERAQALDDARRARGNLSVCRASATSAGGDGAGNAAASTERGSIDGRPADPDEVLAVLAERVAARSDRYGDFLLSCRDSAQSLESAVQELRVAK
jgi:hypothetical protein